MTARWRVNVAAKSFDVQQRTGTGRDGEPTWITVAHCRNRGEVLRVLRRRGLPESLADDLPRFHPDLVRAADRYIAGEIQRRTQKPRRTE